MALPAPGYATTVTYTLSGATIPIYNAADAIFIQSLGGSPTINEYIIWDNLLEYEQQAILDLVDRYGGTLPLAGPVAAEASVIYSTTTVGGDTTGLNANKYYHLTIFIDGVAYRGKWLGSNISTFTDLMSEIDTLLGGLATASLTSGVLTITAAAGSPSIIEIKIKKGGTRNALRRSNTFFDWGERLIGAVTESDVFNRALLPIARAHLPV